MSPDLVRCPPADDLERLLAEELSAPARETVELHIEECTTCQDRLERLSSEPARSVETRAAAVAGPGARPEFLRELPASAARLRAGSRPVGRDSVDRAPVPCRTRRVR